MNKRIIGIAALVVIGIAWYLFRPELLFINRTVQEDFPKVVTAQQTVPHGGTPTAVVKGTFRGIAHETKGGATIYNLPTGQRILRLSEFATSNGPDLRVYLVAAGDAHDSTTVTRAGFVDLGALKGNIGNQNYDLPADLDLGKYQAVTIWCRRFSVNFGTAPLAPSHS